jgi:hypothetical protein
MKKLKHVKLFENFNSNDFKQLLGKSIRRIEWMNDATDYEDGIMIINTDDGMYELSGVEGGNFYEPQFETYGDKRDYIHLDEYDYEINELDDFKWIDQTWPGHKITTVESLNDIKEPLHMTPTLEDIAKDYNGLHLKIANQEALDSGGFVTLVIYGDDIQIKKTTAALLNTTDRRRLSDMSAKRPQR